MAMQRPTLLYKALNHWPFYLLIKSLMKCIQCTDHQICASKKGHIKIMFNNDRHLKKSYECSPWTPPSIWAEVVLFSNLSSPEYIMDLK